MIIMWYFFTAKTGSFRMVSEEEQTLRSKLEHLTVKDHGPVFGLCHKLPAHTVQKVESYYYMVACRQLFKYFLWFALSISFALFQAKDELNETEERRVSSLKDLRAMMKERTMEGDNLAKLVLEQFWDKPNSLLLRFLRARKFDIVRAHELMKGEY